MKENNGKVIRFRPNPGDMLGMAVRRADEGDCRGALRILNKAEEFYGRDYGISGLKAHVYGLMDLSGMAAAKWIEYIDECWDNGTLSGEELSVGYEGLSSAFYNLNDMESSAYYFNAATRLAERGEDRADYGLVLGGRAAARPPEEDEEYYDPEEDPDPPPRIRVVWPPERADYTDEINDGIRLLRRGDLEGAAEKFLSVPEESRFYAAARNYLAMTFLFAGRRDEAEGICERLLAVQPDNVDILCTYAAVLTDGERPEESAALARRLHGMNITGQDELYKAATVCCENGLYEDGYAFLLKMEESFDLSLSYMKGVAAFKSGRTEESLRILGDLLDIYPEAEVARYAYTAIRAFSEGEMREAPALEFVYRVPRHVRDERLGALADALRLSRAEQRNFRPDEAFRADMDWLFDQVAGGDASLQYFAAKVSVTLNLETYLKRLFLDYTVPDEIKLDAFRTLCMRNRDFEQAVVIANIYRRFRYRKLCIGRSNRKVFLEAYAACVIRFSLFGDGDPEEYRREMETLYRLLEESGNMDLAVSPEVLCCVVYLSLREHEMVKAAEVASMMKTNRKEVSAILRLRRRMRPLRKEEIPAESGDAGREGAEKAEPAGSGEGPADENRDPGTEE